MTRYITRGRGGTHIKKKNRGKETERNLLFCLVKAEVLFLDSLIKVSFAILSSRWEGTWAVRQTDSPLPHAHVHKRMHKRSPEHIIIRSTIWLTRGSSSIAQMLLPHKSVIKTSLRVAAPLVTWPALTFSIKYPPPRPTVAFSSPANWIQMYISSLFPCFSLFPYIYIRAFRKHAVSSYHPLYPDSQLPPVAPPTPNRTWVVCRCADRA